MAKQLIKKIVVNKNDEVALIVEKVIDAAAKEIVLNIPRFSKLADSLANFHLIKRESKLLEKKIIIESVDDKAIELANLAGLESLNPVLARSRRQFSDIVSGRLSKEEPEENFTKKRKTAEAAKHREAPFPFRKVLKWSFAGVLIVAALILVFRVLPRAEIKAITKKISWSYADSIIAEKLGTVNPLQAKIPAQVFVQDRSLSFSFPASGKKKVEQKAAGKITIYNAYSSDPQPLVATTRFVTPDGKIFRLTKGLTVPGAKIVSGKIIASSIETSVVADKSGTEYNIGPVNYFSVPGFEGTPKYQGFYGESKAPMSGGFIGEVPFPTDEDVRMAKQESLAKIEEALKDQISAQIPPDFKVIDGAAHFNASKQNVKTSVDEERNFTVVVEAVMKLLAFREQDLIEMLLGRARAEVGDEYRLKDYDLSYGKARIDVDRGLISFPVEFKGVLSKLPDPAVLRGQVLGKSEDELRALVLSLSDLETAQISLWPFWVRKVPNREEKVKIFIE